jgi:hypothetical protein
VYWKAPELESIQTEVKPMNIEEILAHPAFWIVVAAASELIGLSKLKDNSVVQLLFSVLRTLKAKKG